MRASLDIAGIEIELSVPSGPLETAIATRYASFLGPVRTPVCALRIEPWTRAESVPASPGAIVERAGPTRFDVAHERFCGTIDVAGDGMLRTELDLRAIDEALRTLFALLAPVHEGMLLRAGGLIADGRAQVLVGARGVSIVDGIAGYQPTLAGGCVLIRRSAGDSWVAGSLPFGSFGGKSSPPRVASLDRLWLCRPAPFREPCPVGEHEATQTVMDSALLPTADTALSTAVVDLARQLVSAVPAAALARGAFAIPSRQSTARVRIFAGRSATGDWPHIQTSGRAAE